MACGEVIDGVIVQNRMRTNNPRVVRRQRKVRQPIRTLSAYGIAGFSKLYSRFADIAPLRKNVSIDDVGNTAVFLASDLSSGITGEVVYVDSGFNVLGVPTLPEQGGAS